MKKIIILFTFILVGCSSKTQKRYVPDSNGNLNSVTVVMSNSLWEGELGEVVRNEIASIYEGLPIDEPQFSLKQIPPKVFEGFARNSRNILWFRKDSLPRFELRQDQFAKPQILVYFSGEDQDIMKEYVLENTKLIQGLFQENERKEKLRRIEKSVANENSLENRFNISLTYPSAYKTVKDTTNFVWIEKPVQKGTLNIVAYSLPMTTSFKEEPLETIVRMRDSIGELYIPGRLRNTHMVTEKEYLPYLFKTTLNEKEAFLTKGMWAVNKRDYMAGPFVNYTIKDTVNKRWMVIEGFTFAPSVAKRDYMFELNTILSTFSEKQEEKN